MRNTSFSLILGIVAVSGLALSLTQPSIPDAKEEVPDCVKIALEIVKSAPRVKEIASQAGDNNRPTSFLLEDMISHVNSGLGHGSKYVFKLGVSGPEWFETIATFCLYPQEGLLTESNWLTGEEKSLIFDKTLLTKLPESCR